jgi:hypothetical protein
MRVPKTVKNGVYSLFRWLEDEKPPPLVGPAGAPVICHKQGGQDLSLKQACIRRKQAREKQKPFYTALEHACAIPHTRPNRS